jgi:hypothetical protein
LALISQNKEVNGVKLTQENCKPMTQKYQIVRIAVQGQLFQKLGFKQTIHLTLLILQ